MNDLKLDRLQHQGKEQVSSYERRTFLKLGLAVTGVLAGGALLQVTSHVGKAYASSSHLARYPYKPHYAMLVKVDRCIDCERCLTACAKTNHVPDYGYRTSILEREMAGAEGQQREFVPVLCNQCNLSQCTRVCPTKATYKNQQNGIVMMDRNKCIGCLTCQLGCPYNARYFNEENMAVDKCDFCWESRLSQNKKKTACSAACPAGARVFGDLSSDENEVYQTVHQIGQTVWVLRPEAGTRPSVFYTRG